MDSQVLLQNINENYIPDFLNTLDLLRGLINL